MKYKAFFQLTVSIILFCSAPTAIGCGPYPHIIPTPDFFAIKNPKSMNDYYREENLRLWQTLTSKDIPLTDIEQVVYKDKLCDYDEYTWYYKPKPSTNLLYVYLNNTKDDEVAYFIRTAKEIEEKWHKKQSPWYYPQDRNHQTDLLDFQNDINCCKRYDGNRLKDRYALQVVRALFASHQFEDCIEYYDSVFQYYPATNLMKRMAQRYVAGCWSRLDENSERADSIYAQAGDIWSIGRKDRISYMMKHNPNAPQIMEYIRANNTDVKSLAKLLPIARDALKNREVINKGDWAFLLAYFYNKYTRDRDCAAQYIAQALHSKFSTDELHDLARAYKMKIDASSGGNYANLLNDLKWIENKYCALNKDANEWIRITRNILYEDWIPQLWKTKDYATAILLASYADNINSEGQHITWYNYTNMPIDSIRESDEYFNSVDYSSLSFQMMGSLSSSQLASAYTTMMVKSPLNVFLHKNIRKDSDYYNELIGTLALREENYARAIHYLSKVSDKYERTMNIYKGGYLGRDPFKVYPPRWHENYRVGNNYRSSFPKAKLEFARKMLQYQQMMKNGKTNDERGWARLMYAIGRRNSFEECWALTQYWRGEYVGLFEPDLYGSYDFAIDNYDFLYGDPNTVGRRRTESLYRQEVTAAIAMLESDEMRASAEYLLGNLVTVIKHYPDTQTAQFVKTSCDNWQSWL